MTKQRPETEPAERDTPVLEEIEFEIRQWYAGKGDLRACANRILFLSQHWHEKARHPTAHL